MASTSRSLTPAEIAKVLNKELNVASSDIHDVLLDYFTTDVDHADSDSDVEGYVDAFAGSHVYTVRDATIRQCTTDEHSVDSAFVEADAEVPLLKSTMSEVHEITKWLNCNLANDDKAIIEKFVADGCKCNRKCSNLFTVDELLTHRLQMKELDYYDINHVSPKNMVIVSQFAALCDSSETTSSSHKQNKTRVKSRNSLMFKGREVCLPVFLFANDIGIKRYRLLKQQYGTSGIEPHMHGNAGKPAKHRLLHADCEQILLFLKHYSEQFGLVLPGRVPGFKATDLVLLPSSLTKRELHRNYVTACDAKNIRAVGYDSFRRVWKEALPNTVIQKPRSDLCATCHRNLTLMSVYRGMSEDDKMDHLTRSISHLELVKRERKVYTDAVIAARRQLPSLHSAQLGPHITCSSDVELHVSFDYAQQVHIPFDPQQPGEIYFLVPYKVGLFGIMNEAINKQVTYLIPESVTVSKGSNAVISFVDHYFDNYGLGEARIVIHADNCTGQNKNNFLLAYFMWRVMTGRHKSVKFCFLPVGLCHTKVSSLLELKQCFEASSPVSGVNVACLVGSEGGEVYVPVRDWQTFLMSELKYKRIAGIKNNHYFSFHSEHPGQVEIKEHSEAPVSRICMTAISTPCSEKPAEITPDGLSHDRKLYLYEKIRQFCSDETKDILCPEPSERDECSEATTNAAKESEVGQPTVEDDEEAQSLPPVKRRKPLCSYCKQSGHRNSVKRDGSFWCPKRQVETAVD